MHDSSWWVAKKHILVRENARLAESYPDNEFKLEISDGSLWLTGKLLNFFDFECRYPSSYPSAPPDIFPKNRSSKWVPKHQYVKEGRFCLDVREKTWNSTMSVVDILNSLAKLLIAEKIREKQKEEKLIFDEEDEPTKLQRRIKDKLCIIPSDISLPTDTSFGLFSFFWVVRSGTNRIVLSSITRDDKPPLESELAKLIWKSEHLRRIIGLWIRVPFKTIVEATYSNNSNKFWELLRDKSIIPPDFKVNKLLNNDKTIYILLTDDKYINFNFILKFDVESNTHQIFGTYYLDINDVFNRIPNKGDYQLLQNKTAVIVGCGSIGSKVAEYLCKAGVEKLILIDGDIIETSNVTRHSCQLDDISIEKPYALANKLHKINPRANIMPLTWNAYSFGNIEDKIICKADIFIVATAINEEVYNAYTFANKIPTIFMKVYPLGFGGEVFRVIPSSTPCYECLHYQVEKLLEDNYEGAEFPKANTAGYDQTEDGQNISVPALAIDADFISLIASKTALEVLLKDKLNDFKEHPNIWLWGNKQEWIFDQGFQCIKIESKDMSSLSNCIVCHGTKVIEAELGMTTKQVNTEHKDIISTIEDKGSEQSS